MDGANFLRAHGDDWPRWISAWEACGREPFAHPAYGRLFCGPTDTPILFRDPRYPVVIPLIVRELGCSVTQVRDAASPYGYGGPFGGSVEQQGLALDSMNQEAQKDRWASIFVRQSLDSHAESAGFKDSARCATAANVVVDLERSEHEVWRAYESKVRKNVNKAVRSGLVTRTSEQRPPDFVAVYQATMTRRGASSNYMFDANFFDRLDSSGVGIIYFSVEDGEGQTVSVEAVLESDTKLYSFLGGTLDSAFHMAPNDLLKHTVILYGLKNCKSAFVLGGGFANEDGIFRYKRSFSPEGVTAFHTIRSIPDRESFTSVSHHESVSRGESKPLRPVWGHELEASFFPRYRKSIG